ncbi:unnamed protein product [Coccothraustes coccothraustes]
MEPVAGEEEVENAAEPWLLLCGRKVSVRLGAAAPLPACLPEEEEEEETRSPCGAPPAPGHFGGGVFSHISLLVTGLPAPGSAIFGARASRELRRGRGAECRSIGRRGFLGSFPPLVRSRRSGGAMLSRCRRGGLRERRGGGRGSCSGGRARAG